MNKILEENVRFRYTLYDKCNEYPIQETCTNELAQTCERLRAKIINIILQRKV